MKSARKLISTAIYNLINATPPPGATQWASSCRGARAISNVSPLDQPFFSVICPQETASQQKVFGLTRWEREYVCLVYLRRDATPTPTGVFFEDLIDDFIDSIDAAFAGPIKGQKNTLGGLVENCWIDGTIESNTGILDQQALIIIPIKIVTGI